MIDETDSLSGVQNGEKRGEYSCPGCEKQAGFTRGLIVVALLRCCLPFPLLLFGKQELVCGEERSDVGMSNNDRMVNTPAVGPVMCTFCIKLINNAQRLPACFSTIGWPDGNTSVRNIAQP